MLTNIILYRRIFEAVMIRIGICDDNELNNLQIEKYVIRYLKNNNIDAEIEYFVKADEVISYMKEEGEFDILF